MILLVAHALFLATLALVGLCYLLYVHFDYYSTPVLLTCQLSLCCAPVNDYVVILASSCPCCLLAALHCSVLYDDYANVSISYIYCSNTLSVQLLCDYTRVKCNVHVLYCVSRVQFRL